MSDIVLLPLFDQQLCLWLTSLARALAGLLKWSRPWVQSVVGQLALLFLLVTGS